MAARWCESFQVYPSTTNMVEGAWQQIDPIWSLSTVNPPEGGQNIRAATTVSEGGIRRIYGVVEEEGGGWAYRFYVPNLPTNNLGNKNACIQLGIFMDANANISSSVVLGTDGSILLFPGDGSFGSQSLFTDILQRSDPGVVVPAAYNHIEFFDLPQASDGGLEARVNGVTVLNFTGDLQGSSDGTLVQIGIWFGGGNGCPYMDVSDMHVWDPSPGQGPQSFVGNAAVLTRALDSDSSPEEWTPTSSGVPTYELLQDNNDTTGITADEVGLIDSFGAASFPSDVIGVVYQQANFRAFKTGAGDCDVAAGFYSEGELFQGPAFPIAPAPTWYWDICADDPATSGAPFSVPNANASKLALIRTL